MAGHLLCWSNPRPAPPSCPCRHPFSADCLEVSAGDSLRSGGLLRNHCPKNCGSVGEASHVGSGSGRRSRPQSDPHTDPLSPRGRRQRQLDRLFRGTPHKKEHSFSWKECQSRGILSRTLDPLYESCFFVRKNAIAASYP